MNLGLPGGKRDLIKKAGSSIFISVAIASVILAFSIVSLRFMFSQMQYNSRVHAAKEESRDTLSKNISKAAALEASYEQLDLSDNLLLDQGDKMNSDVVLDALPSRYDFPALVASMNKLANESGVKLVGFGGDDLEVEAIATQPLPEPQEIIFTLSVDGNYSLIENFVKNLDNTIRPMHVEKMRLSGTDSDMTATFNLITYYQPVVDLNLHTRIIK